MSSTRLMPKTTTPRPPLPTKWNTYLANLERNPVVKFQPIRKDGAVVYVGRIKVEVPPDEHNIPQKAYVLRRYDTGCISLTTMWRAAFPGTLPLVEKEEITWVRTNYDLGANTAKEATRLAGVWISVELARNFAPSYNLTNIVNALANAEPDMETLRAKEQPPPAPTHMTTPSGPNKRRKDAHESPALVLPATPKSTNGHPLTPVSVTPVSTTKAPVSATKTPASASKAPVSATKAPTTTTSQRAKSPGTGSRRSTPSRSV
ncbi:hypothetical protein FRC16_005009, partial [Serendipita sp. 398]